MLAAMSASGSSITNLLKAASTVTVESGIACIIMAGKSTIGGRLSTIESTTQSII